MRRTQKRRKVARFSNCSQLHTRTSATGRQVSPTRRSCNAPVRTGGLAHLFD
jgi:hypothetical protein